ncbi:hypothetical protein BDV95DRAFT_605470 [Massariosphaeria phaeospora]|uniref:Uncharacterized protein n=1 Tax=Massariosphaeria phaeospora TaxID=100035 RepID=A0A7C8MBP8_9PLEO|nr:hypothetical protein BDV95DRAFT_605470 [Massariosphaeria phaeospora]
MKLSSVLLAAVSVAGLAAGNQVSPRKGQKVGVARGELAINQTPDLGYKELWDLQNMFYTRFKYPNNVNEVESINSTIFSDDVQGRVSDTRNFEGRELNTEYIFGLFVPSDAVSIIGRPGDFQIIQFTANRNIASASTRVNFTFPSFNNVSFPVQIDTWLAWNSERRISQYDVTFRWFAYLLPTLIQSLDRERPEEALKTLVAKVASSICDSHETSCTGENKQYDSRQECYDFLTKEIRVGQGFELGMNTLLCRNIHEHMIKARPGVHCSHIGRDGGGMCDDSISYQTKVEEQYFRNSPWVPETP